MLCAVKCIVSAAECLLLAVRCNRHVIFLAGFLLPMVGKQQVLQTVPMLLFLTCSFWMLVTKAGCSERLNWPPCIN